MSTGYVRLEATADGSLADQLFERGVEMPCGGLGQCGGCKVRVIEGQVDPTPAMREVLTARELADGWRLGCVARATGPVTLAIAQWSVQVLDDQERVPFESADGVGAVVDLGTTTLVAQLVDRASGTVTGVLSGLNPQARHGADLMSRVQFELANPGVLGSLVRAQVGKMLQQLAGSCPVEELLLVGNTVMHHLFCGQDVAPLAAVPFRSPASGEHQFPAEELDWTLNLRTPARFLPCIGGFVGSDLLAGLVAVDMAGAREPCALLDLGTNGEIAVGDARGIVCASTAAGPAFEGGRISCGMRAGAGAIHRARAEDGRILCDVLGSSPARGLCGSGLVDVVAAALDLKLIDRSGRVPSPSRLIPLAEDVVLRQSDIRELQLAKAALAAGLELLVEEFDARPTRLYLAGAFGNYVHAPSAARLGLLPGWARDPIPAGNSALRGARMLLLSPSKRDQIIHALLALCRHQELATSPRFQDTYVGSMPFPAR